jgi:hypothetical protein
VQTVLAFFLLLRNVQINLEVKRGDFQQIGANLGLLPPFSSFPSRCEPNNEVREVQSKLHASELLLWFLTKEKGPTREPERIRELFYKIFNQGTLASLLHFPKPRLCLSGFHGLCKNRYKGHRLEAFDCRYALLFHLLPLTPPSFPPSVLSLTGRTLGEEVSEMLAKLLAS